jgi:uncharacterized protein
MTHIRSALPQDYARILALNDSEVLMTSALDLAGLERLASLACYFKVALVADAVAGFLLALEEHADYPNDNYAYFAARYARFVYVDRIVVSRESAGMGIGTQLYENLFAYARSSGSGTVTCEYNLEPPNPASRRFHERFGFREIGTQHVMQGKKRVTLQALDLR